MLRNICIYLFRLNYIILFSSPQGDYYMKEYRHDTSKMPVFVPDLKFYTTLSLWENALKKKKVLFLYVMGQLENEVKPQKRPKKKTRQPK